MHRSCCSHGFTCFEKNITTGLEFSGTKMSDLLENESEEEETKRKVGDVQKPQKQHEERDEEEYEKSESVTVEDSESASHCNNDNPLQVTQWRRNANSKVATKEALVAEKIILDKRRYVKGGSSTEEEPVGKKRKGAKNDKATQPEKGQPQQQQQQQGRKMSKKAYVFQYGNYHRYYGYRLGKTVDEDPRLKYFQRDWFEGKDCLDIGCNEGFVTISIAQKYKCRSILGVDLDHFLIKKAISNLQEAAAASETLKEEPLEDGLPEETVGLRICGNTEERCGETAGNQCPPESDGKTSFAGSASLQQTVKFRQEQFIEDFPHGDYKKDGTFDTVLCLSVTKWVHLNWGDTGLIRLFAKIFHILRPGGIFILEPQPWKSYLKKYYVSEVTKRCFENIQLRPEHFKEVLLDKIGFKSVEEVSKAVPNSSLGFDRSLFLYVK